MERPDPHTRRKGTHSILASILFLLSSTVDATCYRRDGNPVVPNKDIATWRECNPGAGVTTCCSEIDLCLDNGLCLGFGGPGVFYIQGCTDSSWPKSSCPAYCDGPDDGYGNIRVWRCTDDGNYCCGFNDCCGDKTIARFSVPNPNSGAHPPIPGSTSPSSPSSASEQTQTRSSVDVSAADETNSSAPESVSAGSDDAALRVGLGVGISLGVLLLALVGWIAWDWRRGAGGDIFAGGGHVQNNYQTWPPPQEVSAHGGHGQNYQGWPPQEMHSTTPARELYGS
ncbi:hypothetical protein SAPIO_CDS0423 [Scedosporium apiospermum]|uniref:Uncharacterized protein n=1 Tax=Pseudallescheria apiosperma TaxID=563466 RepID=A0A084GGZ4_PSEDA|nr:uncharacterized protein SAPIO_CDS0423 [Scedosporium apiospermum]KEZ46606.1 hypothetical protein SAPIO_CDS0423 [Scedosporium apiospermum]